MPVDDELLARTNTENEEDDEPDESEMAGDFRAEKRQGGNSLADSPVSIRELRQRVLIRQKLEKAKAASEASRSTTNPMRQATDKLLQASWENLIDSFGLTLIWIDIHVFLNKTFGPKVFCNLGDEWIPAEAKKALGNSDAGDKSLALVEKVEEIGCGCLNLVVLIIIIALFAQIAFIAQALEHPFDTLVGLIGSVFPSFYAMF
jgi:hypothetical protein